MLYWRSDISDYLTIWVLKFPDKVAGGAGEQEAEETRAPSLSPAHCAVQAGRHPAPARAVFGQPRLLQLPALLGVGRRVGDDDLPPGQQSAPLAEGAVGEDGVVAGRQQGEVVSDVVRRGQRVLHVLLQYLPVPGEHHLEAGEHEVALRPVHVVRDDDEDDVAVLAVEPLHGPLEVAGLQQVETVESGQVVPVVSPPVVNPHPGHLRPPDTAVRELHLQPPRCSAPEPFSEPELPSDVRQILGEVLHLVGEISDIDCLARVEPSIADLIVVEVVINVIYSVPGGDPG